MEHSNSEARKGVYYALTAYFLWGISPLYWKALTHLPLSEVFCHRILWSALTCFIVISFFKKKVSFTKKNVLPLLATTFLISINWVTYLYAINNNRLLEASLGYFINPILNIVLGLIILKEKLGKLQWAAVTLAAFAVLNEIVTFGKLPWISLLLAFSFGLYGLIRKMSSSNALISLTMECSLLSIPASLFLGHLSFEEKGHFFLEWQHSLLFIGGGIFTALPLLFFGPATKKIKYSTIGIIQYLAPTLHFILAISLYNEPFQKGKFLTFIPIWIALFLYSFGGLLKEKSS